MLIQRIITALILAPIAIACIFYLPESGFALFVGIVLTIGAWEWGDFARFSPLGRVAYAAAIALLLVGAWFVPPLYPLVFGGLWWCLALGLMLQYPAGTELWGGRAFIAMIGPFALVPGFVGLLLLKQTMDANFLILLLFLLIWGADIGAYFTGRNIGKTKLAPKVSPGKTWEGLGGGVVTSLLIAVGMVEFLGKPDLLTPAGMVFLLVCVVVVLVSAEGDLVISMFKRHRGIKDSSKLLPGHGGVLDRIDSLLSAAPAFALYILLVGWQ